MKRILILLIAIAAIYFTGCSKSNKIPAVTGTVNGMPATSLYGTSGNASDYILFVSSTIPADRLLSYEGPTYSYTTNATTGDIYIQISLTNVVHGTLTTSGNKITLTVTNSSPPIFISSVYTSR